MEQSKKNLRWLRAVGALLLGLLILAATLPSTGYIYDAGLPPNPRMWRCGPFLFYPASFFIVVGAVVVSIGCTLFGIARRNACEGVGWVLLGLAFVALLLGA